MKKLVFLCLFLGVIEFSFAVSPINLGLKAGYTSSKLTTSLDQFNDGSVSNFLVGAFVRVNLRKWYLQPEGYFTSKGGHLKDVSTDSFDLNSLDVPLLLGYKVVNLPKVNLRLNAGPVFSFITKKQGENNNSEFDYNNIKDNYVGIQYGAGVDFLFLTLDARLENSLGDVHSGAGNEKIKLFMVTLGIKFL